MPSELTVKSIPIELPWQNDGHAICPRIKISRQVVNKALQVGRLGLNIPALKSNISHWKTLEEKKTLEPVTSIMNGLLLLLKSKLSTKQFINPFLLFYKHLHI